MLTLQRKKEMLKQYLGFFFVKMDKKDIDEFRKIFKYETTFVKGNREYLRKVGCFYLTNWNYQYYSHVSSSDIWDLRFDRELNAELRMNSKFLIIFHSIATPINRALESWVTDVVDRRLQKGKKTLVLAEINALQSYAQIENFFKYQKLPIVVGEKGLDLSIFLPVSENDSKDGMFKSSGDF